MNFFYNRSRLHEIIQRKICTVRIHSKPEVKSKPNRKYKMDGGER